jgi:hypothetical protein
MTVVDINRGKRSYRRAPRDLMPIDKTSGAARFFDRMVREIEVDLGRHDITRIEGELIRAFAGAATTLQYLTHQVLLGDASAIDLSDYATMASTMLRIGSRLGLSRRAKLVPGLHDRGGLLDQMEHERARAVNGSIHDEDDAA